jgi:hypothetical protein
MNVARIYLRVSTEEQDLTRQAEIEHNTRAAGYYIAGVYREKASGARADRPELLRMAERAGKLLDETFERIQGLAREDAQKLDREIEIALTGAETELDKSVVEKVSGPLLHLVRNALAHGTSRPMCVWRRKNPPRGGSNSMLTTTLPVSSSRSWMTVPAST